MSAMKNLYMSIEELLDTTNMLCDDIAEKVGCPVRMVHDVVEHRWIERHLQPDSREFETEAYVEMMGA
jgi:uncharacterized protein YutE (UPF0331/DUF86 family)